MSETVTLRDANQKFAALVRAVESGKEFVITRRGRPVAKLSPVRAERVLTPSQKAALRRSLKRMRKGWDLGAGPLDRDAIHER